MDDSDDYFGDDDFVIDDATAAALDATERRHATQALQPPPQPQRPQQPQQQQQVPQHPSKRLKTTTGWSPGIGSRADSVSDIDLPEISIQGNGYAISNANGASTSYQRPQPAPPVQRSTSVHQNQRPQALGVSSSSSFVAPGLNPQRPVYNTVQRANAQASRPGPPPRASTTSAVNARRSAQPVAPPLDQELRQLKQALEELRQSNDKIRAELNSAMDARVAKEGEVTILRRNMEKNSVNHAAEIAKLKASKEEAEAQVLRIQKSNKEEMDRLKTQLLFKQQDLEANMRKVPASVRIKKTINVNDIPSTPFSSIRSNPFQATPSKVLTNRANENVKMASPKKSGFKSPEKVKKPMLPGFQNAFTATSTPLPSQYIKNKGKAKATDPIFPPPPSLFSQPPPPTIPQQSQTFNDIVLPGLDSPPRPPLQTPKLPLSQLPNDDVFGEPRLDQDGDALMDVDDGVVYEDCGAIEATNWKAELSRIMLTHAYPSSGQLTLQLLLNVKFENHNDDPEAPQLFMKAYNSLINALSTSASMADYDQTLDTICSACSTLAQVLCSTKSIECLTSLFNLLTVVLIYIPKFRSHLYRQSPPNDPDTCSILDVCHHALTNYLSPKDNPSYKATLGVQLLELFEALSFQSSDHDIIKFSRVVRDRTIITTLLDPAQPILFLHKAVRALVLLSTHSVLYRDLLTLSEGPEDEEIPRNGILDKVCTLLAESNRDGLEYLELRQHLLCLIAQLSLAHSDAHAELISSNILLPSLVFHLHQITSPIFEEEDKTVATDEETLFNLVKFISQCVYLVRHLVMSAYPDDNLYKLQHPPYRGLKSAPQMFVVTFAHLAWTDTDAIVWLSERCKRILARLKGVAEFIFNSVIEGPEGDDVQFTLQDATLASSDDDAPRMDVEPEQMEAELISTNMEELKIGTRSDR